MKLSVKSVSTGCLLFLLLTAPSLIAGSGTLKPGTITKANIATIAIKSKAEALALEAYSLYDSMNLKSYGLSKKAFEYAWRGYQYLQEKGRLVNNNILSICDFSQSSRRKRMYIIDLEQQKVLINTYVAHGRNSGAEYARSFSNSPESHKSSLGFYVTKTTYYGGHGLALTIDGMEKGINDKAFARKIVVHGSNYVGSNFIKSNKFNGRSFGCPAIPASQTQDVINTIKNGSCLFIYHPNKKYISQSKILNS
ncbi:MAG: murein L,D-transpeptidase catalytic domain family protein [Flavihumibacter sp.]|nr:murein L,D-transpeptidase catalytic domain family protein [Flavihumibacter sp.]